MIRLTGLVAVAVCFLPIPLGAQDVGAASGKGVIERLTPPKTPGGEGGTEEVSFSPRYAYAYRKGTGAKAFTWIVLTEKEPPAKDWAAARDREEARRAWCQKEKTSFTAVKLDAQMHVDLYFLCPANGAVNTEMLNTVNGLESVAVKFEAREGKRLKGTLRTGQGNCPGPDGKGGVYCTPTGDYTFDVTVSK
jgi:hypothetical protein